MNTGAAHMLSITAFAGTASISGLRMIRDLESIGAHISSSSDREKVRHIRLLSFTTESILMKFLTFSSKLCFSIFLTIIMNNFVSYNLHETSWSRFIFVLNILS